MQDPNLDTEWNDVLRKHGIIPNKNREITEEQFLSLANETIDNFIEKQNEVSNVENFTLEQLNEAEDTIDDELLEKIRLKRKEELKNMNLVKKFGTVTEITAATYTEEVNKAGDDIWVVLHLYQSYIDKCKLINEALNQLAIKYQTVKFVKGIASDCIKDYPDKNVPTIFIFKNSEIKAGYVGSDRFIRFNYKNSTECLEWMLSSVGVIRSNSTKDPFDLSSTKKTQISSSIFGTLKQHSDSNNNSSDDYFE